PAASWKGWRDSPRIKRLLLYLRHADHAAADSASGVADRLGEVVILGVDDDASAEDGVLAGDAGRLERHLGVRLARCVGLDVAHVADVAHAFTGLAVLVAFGIEVPAGAHGLFHVATVAE